MTRPTQAPTMPEEASPLETEPSAELELATRRYVRAELPMPQVPRISNNPDAWLQETVAILSETSIEMVRMMAQKPQEVTPFMRVFSLVTHLAADSKKLLQQGGGGHIPPIAPTGATGDNGDMEAKIARLEARMDTVQRDITALQADVRDIRRDITGIRTTDFRLIFGAIITVALGLAWMMAKGFGWL